MEKHGSAQNYIGQKFGVNFDAGKSYLPMHQIIPGLAVGKFMDLQGDTSIHVSITHSGFVFQITGCAIIHIDYSIIGNFPIYQVFSNLSPYFMITNFEGEGDIFPPHLVKDDDSDPPIDVIYTFRNSIVFVTDEKHCPTPILWMGLNGQDFSVLSFVSSGFAKGLKKLYLNESERFSAVWHAAKRHGHTARIAKALGMKPMDIEVSIRGTEISSFI